MQTLVNFTSLDPIERDTWEVGMFKHDCEGRELEKSLLGVRVNGGTWLEMQALVNFASKFMDTHVSDS